MWLVIRYGWHLVWHRGYLFHDWCELCHEWECWTSKDLEE